MNVTLKRVISPTVAPTLHVLLEQYHVMLKVHMCMICMALMTIRVLRAKPQNSYASVNTYGTRVVLSTLIHKALVYIRILGVTACTGINEGRRSVNCTEAGTHAKLDMNLRMNGYIPLHRDE